MKSAPYELDEHLRFRNVSAALAKGFGMTQADLEGQSLDSMVTQECAPNFLEAALDVMRGYPVKTLRLEMIQKDRKKIDVEMSVLPVDQGSNASVDGIRGEMKFLPERVVC